MAETEVQTHIRAHIPDVSAGVVDGEMLGQGGDQLDVVNPDTGHRLLTLAECDQAVVSRAVQSARSTFQGGDWSNAPIAKRQDVLRNAAALIRERAEMLAGLDSFTTGLLFHSAMHPQALAGAGWFDYFASLIEVEDDKLFRQSPETMTTVTRDPVGVVALFTPWNIPIMGASLKLSAALAAGNSCIIKPSEQSPLGTVALVNILHEAGLPRGVLHLVNGRGGVTGAALAASADVDAISFTGGENAGRIIAGEASKRFAKVTMELGGKSANIIFDDADYERALDGALMAVYANNGQACLAGSRIFVHKNIADRFIADFTARAKKIKIGRPFDAEAELGPQSSRPQMERVLSFLEGVRDDGGEVLTGGSRNAALGDGFYVEPIVTLATNNKARVCQEEIFGPFATFLVFDDDESVIAQANDTKFGLAAYVWTENLSRAHRTASRLRAGYVLINTPMMRERNAPFGGYGQSGLDREGGRWSLDFYSETKTTVAMYGAAAIPALGKS